MSAPTRSPNYCKAYLLGSLRAFDGWTAGAEPAQAGLADDDLAYLSDEFAVLGDPVSGQPLLFAGDAPGWREFCTGELGFAMPADLVATPADDVNHTDDRGEHTDG